MAEKDAKEGADDAPDDDPGDRDRLAAKYGWGAGDVTVTPPKGKPADDGPRKPAGK